MKKSFKNIIKVIGLLAFVAAICVGIFASVDSMSVTATEADDVLGTKRYIIDNPYETVDWDNWRAYKAATHVHSNISDGDIDFPDMIENYYNAGFDCLSMTDHGTVNYGWTVSKSRHTIFAYQLASHGSPEPLSATRNAEITTGVGRDGRKMIDIPLGIELNGASTNKVHVCGWFADAGDGDMALSASGISGAESAIKKNYKEGGLSHINHVGEWSDGDYNASFINDFAGLYTKYASCMGMELVNTADGRTSGDRYLYDEVLKKLAPIGRGFWGYCEDDAHDMGDIDRNAQYFWMPSNTVENVRTSMMNGAFFCSSKNAKGVYELNGVTGTGVYPVVSRITVDDATSRITFEVANATKMRVVAEGTLIDTIECNASSDTVTIDLNNYESSLVSYVRIYFTGEGGITFVQPFYLTTVSYAESHVNITTAQSYSTIKVFDSQNNLVIPTITSDSSATYTFDFLADYTYEVSHNGYVTKTGSFSITTYDLAFATNKDIQVSLIATPEIQFDAGISCTPDKTKMIIDGFTDGISDISGVAHSSTNEGEIVITPTPNGYGTGTKLSLVLDGETIETYDVVIYGDVDGDGIVDPTDSNLISVRAHNLPMDQAHSLACDINNDGVVNSEDCDILIEYGLNPDSTLDIAQIR